MPTITIGSFVLIAFLFDKLSFYLIIDALVFSCHSSFHGNDKQECRFYFLQFHHSRDERFIKLELTTVDVVKIFEKSPRLNSRGCNAIILYEPESVCER